MLEKAEDNMGWIMPLLVTYLELSLGNVIDDGSWWSEVGEQRGFAS